MEALPHLYVRELQTFLGATGWFRRFIPRYAHRAAPLTRLLKQTVAWVWGAEEKAAFGDLRRALTEAPVLVPPDHNKDWLLYTDASDVALGAVVLQETEDGPRAVAYLSKTLNPAERNYTTRERECLAIVTALKKWHYYFLGGREVRVYTDHNSLTFLRTQVAPLTGRLARWAEEFARFNLTIGYLPGKANVVADALSRAVYNAMPKSSPPPAEENASADAPAGAAGLAAITVVAGDQEFLASLRSALDGDELACRVREVELPVPGFDWVEQEGLLYIQGGEEGAPLRLYIPEGKGLRQRVLQQVHDAGHAGHPGRDRTLARLRPRFYWPNMAEYVREYVLTCPSCQMSKARRGAAPGSLQPLPIPGVPWEVVGMDFIGPLPETPDGKDFILTCVCLLTKMVKLVPMRRPDAEGTARAFNERVLSQMGWPRVVVSDRDPKFMSAFWQRLMQLMRTHLNTSTAYHPQTDGQAERMNRLVGEVLRHFVCADQTDWDELLPMVEFAINSSPNRSTGFTPFYLNYGREPMVPADLLSPAGEPAAGGASGSAAADELAARMRRALDRAKAALATAKEKQAEYANRSRADAPEYKRGDWVLLSTEHLRRDAPGVRKWDRLWTQPLMVLSRFGEVSYRLALPAGVRMHDTFHASLLRPFKRSETFAGREVPQGGYLPTMTEADRQLCDLHGFVDFRRVDGVPQYQVHWVGEWGDKSLTWEPARRLQIDLGKELFGRLERAYRDGAPPALPLATQGNPGRAVPRARRTLPARDPQAEPEEEFTVRAFVDTRRSRGGVLEYLVHWDGDFPAGIGPDKSHCWVPAHTLRVDLDPASLARFVEELAQRNAKVQPGPVPARRPGRKVAAGSAPSASAHARRSPRLVSA